MINDSLPFVDENTWNYLRRHSYVSIRHKLFYVATPKVACTSLEWWFAALEGHTRALSENLEGDKSDPELTIHDNFLKVAPTSTGLMPDQLVEPITSQTYFRFAVVRNPYQRNLFCLAIKITAT